MNLLDWETKMLDFGKVLRERREKEGITLKTLAYELDKLRPAGERGLTESYLSLLETGKREISPRLMRVILQRFPDLWAQAMVFYVSYMVCPDEEKRGK